MKYFKNLFAQIDKDLKSSRLFKRTLVAQWKPIDIKNNNAQALQAITDAMTYNTSIQINYRNSGWRTILPYGWNSSKAGNILLMCYKDTGEIRSYRIDRIYDLLINDTMENHYPGESKMTFNDFQIPTLPNLDQIVEETEAEVDEELPYDIALQALTKNKIPENYKPINTLQDNENNDEDKDINENINNSNSNDDINDLDDIDFDFDEEDNNENDNDTEKEIENDDEEEIENDDESDDNDIEEESDNAEEEINDEEEVK